jgi:hypothetical protein
MPTSLTFPDRNGITEDILRQSLARQYTSLGNFQGTSLGLGLIRYTITQAVTGSAQNIILSVPHTHILLRTEFQQLVTATGVVDTTGINLKVQRRNRIASPGSSGLPFLTLASTNGSTANDSVVFDFSDDDWVSDTTDYNFAFTGQNNDTLTIDIYMRYF